MLDTKDIRVLLPRAREGAERLAEQLTKRGFVPVIATLVETEWLAPTDLAGHLDRCEWIAFASATAVDALRDHLPLLAKKKLAAVGPATADRLTQLGLDVSLVPADRHDGTGLATALIAAGAARVLLPRAKGGREELGDLLRAAEIQVDTVDTYQTVRRADAAEVLRGALAQQPQIVALTAPSLARHLVDVATEIGAHDDVRRLAAACIGETTAQAARTLGLRVVAVARTPSLEALGVAVSMCQPVSSR